MLSQSSLVGAQVSSLKSRIPSQLSSKAVGAVFPRAREDHLPFPRVVVAVLAAATGVDDPVSVEVPGLEDAAHVVLAGVAGAGVLVVAEEAHPDVAPALVRGVRVRVADLEAVAGLPVGAQVVLRLPEAPVELLEADVVGAVELVDAGKLVRPRGDAAARFAALDAVTEAAVVAIPVARAVRCLEVRVAGFRDPGTVRAGVRHRGNRDERGGKSRVVSTTDGDESRRKTKERRRKGPPTHHESLSKACVRAAMRTNHLGPQTPNHRPGPIVG